MVSRSDIYDEIDAERDKQDLKWGHGMDDGYNSPWHWAAYLACYATKWMKGQVNPIGTPSANDFREKMIKTAAIAVAAVESLDRQREANGRAFYE